jgi:anti-anti-sigma factor
MLKVIIRKLGDATVFRCEGRIVFPDAGTLRVAVMMHPRTRLAVLDLAGVNAIDGAGLGILVSLRAWSRATGTRLKLMNLRPKVEYLLELTHLTPLFEISSVREVLELFCRVFNPSQFPEAAAATETPARVLGDTGPNSIEAQW